LRSGAIGEPLRRRRGVLPQSDAAPTPVAVSLRPAWIIALRSDPASALVPDLAGGNGAARAPRCGSFPGRGFARAHRRARLRQRRKARRACRRASSDAGGAAARAARLGGRLSVGGPLRVPFWDVSREALETAALPVGVAPSVTVI